MVKFEEKTDFTYVNFFEMSLAWNSQKKQKNSKTAGDIFNLAFRYFMIAKQLQ